VQAQRTPESTDRDEEIDELRLGRQHLRELVDHQEQRRHRGQILACRAGLLIVADRGVVARLAQQLLAPDHLAAQGVLHAVDQRELVGEVGDDGRDVWHVRHAGEGRTALEVDQHHVELFRRVGHRQPEHQRAQELRLSRTGRADDQTVWPHALLGGFLDVEMDERTTVAEPDRHSEAITSRARTPGGRGVEGVDVSHAHQVHEVRRTGDVGRGAGVLGLTLGDRVQRGEPPGEGFGGRQIALIHLRAYDCLAHAQSFRLDPPVLLGLAGQQQAQPCRGFEFVPAGGQVEHGHAVQAVGGDDVVSRRQGGAVHDEQDVRGSGPFVRAEARAIGEIGRQQCSEIVEGGRDHARRTDRVGLLGRVRVRQPLDPVPVRKGALGSQYGDHQLSRRMHRGGRADDGARPRAGLLLVAADLHPVEGAQVQARGQVRLLTVYDEQPVQGGCRGGVDLVDGCALGRFEFD
jgi:hypothetical protein